MNLVVAGVTFLAAGQLAGPLLVVGVLLAMVVSFSGPARARASK